MDTQVHLNRTRLSILSLPRDKHWLFIGLILRLLHQSTQGKTSEYSGYSDYEDAYRYERTTNHYESESSWSPISANTRILLTPSSDGLERMVDNLTKVVTSDSLSGLSRLSDDINSPQYDSDDDDEESYFFHVAYTPSECTVICSTILMNSLFEEPLKICKELNYNDVKLLEETFLNLQVDSDGSLDKSARIIELTKPLSENKISLFFISSHFSDIVLIPYLLKDKVINILTKKNFQFSDISNSYIMHKNSSEPDTLDHEENDKEEESTKKLDQDAFKLFKDADIEPRISNSIKLLLTGARTGEVNNTIEKTTKVISANLIPLYFAITRTALNEVSLVLPKSTKKRSILGFDSRSIIGSTQDIIIPITIDFSKLPLNATGIVAGLASRIINGIKLFPDLINYPFEMNYFSMARSAVIMIPEENIEVVSKVLDNLDHDPLKNDEICMNKLII
ncbi:uncharacterized protein PRCAT00002258001 [Priceomyces carsonii]|uniref:uncharacterized protein n=1 Tax=Priceomyces carsonii TaxID=28549 RepID=UPI002EDA136F|nr:unnamed protein product [Priceomyces carsonii]